MGTYSSGIDAIFDSMSQKAAADSTSRPTLRPVSYTAEGSPTQPSIRLAKTVLTPDTKRAREAAGAWRWPLLVWSAVVITALAARGTIAASIASLDARVSRRAAAPAIVVAPPHAATATPVRLRATATRDVLRTEREPAPAPVPAIRSGAVAPRSHRPNHGR